MTQLAGIPVRRVYTVHIHKICAYISSRIANPDTSYNRRVFDRAGIGQNLGNMFLQRLPVFYGSCRKLKFILLRFAGRSFFERPAPSFTVSPIKSNTIWLDNPRKINVSGIFTGPLLTLCSSYAIMIYITFGGQHDQTR